MGVEKYDARILQVGMIREDRTSGLSFSIPSLLRGFEKNGIEIDYLNIKENGLRLSVGDLVLKSYDIVVFHSFFIIQHLFVLLKLKRGTKVIVTPRGAFTNETTFIFRKKLFSFLFLKLIKMRNLNLRIHYLTQNEKIKSRFQEFPNFVIGNSIDRESLGVSKTLRRGLDRGLKIVYMGRFHTYIKGLDQLIAHILKFKESYSNANIEFAFYGPDSNDRREFVRAINNSAITNVFIREPVYGKRKEEVLEQADFHILTSRSEGFPMAVLESLAKGCPQILSQGTNMLPLLEEYQFGVEFNDNLFSYLSNLTDDIYCKLSQNAIECARIHSNENIARKTYQEYLK